MEDEMERRSRTQSRRGSRSPRRGEREREREFGRERERESGPRSFEGGGGGLNPRIGRERSLSPYSKRLALTQAMNAGR